MRVFVTGGGGFVGRWLARELEAGGHDVIPDSVGGRRSDVRDGPALSAMVRAAAPDAVVHLAAIASASEAAADAREAFEVTVGGTVNLMEAIRALARPPVVVVAGSSEVYGSPEPDRLPLDEWAPLRPRTPYALSKVAQESVALAYAARHGLSLAVVRAFNHTGPGQRPAFVVPALANRVRDLADGRAPDIPTGNLDVRRDFTDVRDVARAYRLLVEALAAGSAPGGGGVFNVGSGRSISIRRIVELLCEAAGVEPRVRTDPALVRPNDPPEIRADASAIRGLTGWHPEVDFTDTIREVWAASRPAAAPQSG